MGGTVMYPEYETAKMPDEVEVCGRCKIGLVYRAAPDVEPLCTKKGCTTGGARFVRWGAVEECLRELDIDPALINRMLRPGEPDV